MTSPSSTSSTTPPPRTTPAQAPPCCEQGLQYGWWAGMGVGVGVDNRGWRCAGEGVGAGPRAGFAKEVLRCNVLPETGVIRGPLLFLQEQLFSLQRCSVGVLSPTDPALAGLYACCRHMCCTEHAGAQRASPAGTASCARLPVGSTNSDGMPPCWTCAAELWLPAPTVANRHAKPRYRKQQLS